MPTQSQNDAAISSAIAGGIRAGMSRDDAIRQAYQEAGRTREEAEAAIRSGVPVIPDPVCRLDDIASFREGTWNGEPVTQADMRAMAANFAKLSTGPNAYYRPFVSLNHNDALNCGLVDKCYLGPDGLLRMSAADVPEAVGKWANGKRLQAPSIEFWRPERDAAGNIVGTFMGPDGKYLDTPVLKSITLLGNDAPAVKGLGSLPVAKFASSTSVHRFRSESMDRAAMLQTLQGMGFDTTQITDAVPDEVVKAILDFVQGMAQGGGTPAPIPDAGASAGPVAAMSDGTKPDDKDKPSMYADLSAPVAAGMAAGGGTPTTPSAITLKFSDNAAATPALTSLAAQINGVLATITQRGAAIAADMKRQRDQSKVNAIATFADRMKARIPPMQLRAICSTLVPLDHDRVRKFSDSPTVGTALEEAIALHEAAAPTPRVGRERMQQPMPGHRPGSASAPGGTGSGMTPERRAAILAADPLFSSPKKK